MGFGSTAEEGGPSGVAAPRARATPSGPSTAQARRTVGPAAGGDPQGVGAARRRQDPRPRSTDPGRPSVLVLGLGNPLLGDDAVGWRVVEELERTIGAASGGVPGATGAAGMVGGARVATDVLAVGGIGLMERLVGASRAILVDAIETGNAPPGTIVCRRLAEIPIRAATHLDGTHDTPLPVALEAGRALGAPIPDDILVVAIEAVRTDVFSAELSPAVAAAVPRAVQAILTSIAAG